MNAVIKSVDAPIVIDVNNVHCAVPLGLYTLDKFGLVEVSRNGEVVVAAVPVTTFYRKPYQRVILWPERDANPYFHFFESLWMLAGRQDVEYPASFAKQIAQYSDDGATLAGAYGHRWRHLFGIDQLEWVIKRLKNDPNDRRVVLSMWDGGNDPILADKGCKDIPCNTQIYFRIMWNEEGLPELCMQVNCRSNDVLWGAYGANAVHMSMLQEYLADRIGVGVGWYSQMSFNYHVYNNFVDKMKNRSQPENKELSLIKTVEALVADNEAVIHDPYINGCSHFPIKAKNENWDNDLLAFLAGAKGSYVNDFFNRVAVPLQQSHLAYKEGDYARAFEELRNCYAVDWRTACYEWLSRRKIEA